MDYSCSKEKPRHSVDRGMDLGEQRRSDVQGSMFQVQRLNSFRALNIER
jgi:hypothetical protein